jgi:hypothetical protein
VPVPPRRQAGTASDKSANDRNKPQAALEPAPAPVAAPVPAPEQRSILAGLTGLFH